jgi:hypothetical protein
MLQNYKTKCVTVVDNGLFVELAITLSKHFGKVNYYSPWEGPFPKSNQRLVGYGIADVMRIFDVSSVISETDLFVFPDIYHGSLQLELEEKYKKRVWGSRLGEKLELLRHEAKILLKNAGIPIGKYEIVIGLPNLRTYLKSHDNVWVKISLTRGDMESFHSKNYKLIEPRLDELEHSLGAKKLITEFIVEDSIDDAIEIAYDGPCIDGIFPNKTMYGIEVKDKGYVGVVCEYKQLPKQLIEVNKRLIPFLKRAKYRNFISPEMRIRLADRMPFVTDPCCRFGSPPGELQLFSITNLPDILWYGAEGKCIDPEFLGNYGAEMLIHSSWADKNWQAVQFPKHLRENVKLRNLTIINEEYYVVPQNVGLPEIGAIVAVGNTLDEAIGKVQEYSREIEGYYIDLFPDCFDDVHKEIDKLNSIGIKF